MTIDSETIGGGIILWIIFAGFLTFIIAATNPKYFQKENKKVNYVKTIISSLVLSTVFTGFIIFVSLKVDKENLKNLKKNIIVNK